MEDDPYKIQVPSPLKQLGFSLFFGLIAATIAYKITDSMAEPDKTVGSVQTQGAYKFVFFMTALAGGAVFVVTMTLYKKWADRKYRESLGPPPARKLPD
jgi:hypothetical protein